MSSERNQGGRLRPERKPIPWRLTVALSMLVSSLGCNLPRLVATPTMTEGAVTVPAIRVTSTPHPTQAIPPVTVTPSPSYEEHPPSGVIVFTCSIDTFDQICLMNVDGSQVTRLTTTAATEFYASIAPDGTEIVFSSIRAGTFQIYGMNMDGGNLRRLSDGKGSLYAPEISPDGKTIVYTYESGPTQNIWVMDRDGSNPHALTALPGDSLDPTWSPDGNQIAFASNRSGSRQLWVMNRDGSNPRQVTDLPDMGGRSSWSPDRTRLAFYAGPTSDHNIYTIDLSGEDLKQLTSGGDNLAPCYSPDGDWLAFTSFRDLNNEIYIMHPDGSEQTRLTFDPRADWQPRWGR